MIINGINTAHKSLDRALIMRVLNSSTRADWVDPETSNWMLRPGEPVASWLLKTWRQLGVPRHTAIMLIGIAAAESGLDPTIVNTESGAKGLYQGLSGVFGRVASSSSDLNDHIPMMREMIKQYKLLDPISLHGIYTLHFQFSLIDYRDRLDRIRGVVPTSGTTYGAQYATTDGDVSCNDFGLATVTAMLRLSQLFDSDRRIDLSLPGAVLDKRSRPDKFVSINNPVSVYNAGTHLVVGQRATSTDLLDLHEDTTFVSDANINITYYNYTYDHVSTFGV